MYKSVKANNLKIIPLILNQKYNSRILLTNDALKNYQIEYILIISAIWYYSKYSNLKISIIPIKHFKEHLKL